MISVYSTNIQNITNTNTIITIISYHDDNNMKNKHLKVHIYPNFGYNQSWEFKAIIIKQLLIVYPQYMYITAINHSKFNIVLL